MSDSTPSSRATPIEQLAREWVGQIWDDPEDEFYKVQLLLARVRREAIQECIAEVWVESAFRDSYQLAADTVDARLRSLLSSGPAQEPK